MVGEQSQTWEEISRHQTSKVGIAIMLTFSKRLYGAKHGFSVSWAERLQVAKKRENMTIMSEMNEKQKSLYDWIVKQRKVRKYVVSVNFEGMMIN